MNQINRWWRVGFGLVALFGLVFLAAAQSQATGLVDSPAAPATSAVAPARVMVVNLFDQAVDVQLGDQAVFSVAALAPGQPSALYELAATEGQKLYFKKSQETVWRYYQDAAAQPQSLRLASGSVTVIRFGTAGTVDVIDLPLPSVGGVDQATASYCFFLNGSAVALDGFGLVDASLNRVAEVKAIPAQAFTGLVAVTAGAYAPDPAGQTPAALTAFQAGEAYLVMAGPLAAAGQAPLAIWSLGRLIGR